MNAKIVEVVTKILEGLDKNYSLEEVTSKLKKGKDFDEQIVSAAFSLVLEKIIKKTKVKKPIGIEKNFRVLTTDEINAFGIKNYKYIQHMVNIGLLTPMDVELLAEQVKAFPEEKISKDDINWIILFSLVDFDSEVLPGSRVLLYSSDTIN
jgi:uncharacterized protein Smg (DUF494 family)